MRTSSMAMLAALGLTGTAVSASAQVPAAPAQASARGVGDPRAFVEATYARYRAAPNSPPEDPVYSYSDRLRALFGAYDRWQAGHQDLVGSLDFDWWTNSQDWGEIAIRELREERRGANRRTIMVRFVNYDVEGVNRFQFVRQGGRWYLDDVVGGTGGGSDGWALAPLLRGRPQ